MKERLCCRKLTDRGNDNACPFPIVYIGPISIDANERNGKYRCNQLTGLVRRYIFTLMRRGER